MWISIYEHSVPRVDVTSLHPPSHLGLFAGNITELPTCSWSTARLGTLPSPRKCCTCSIYCWSRNEGATRERTNTVTPKGNHLTPAVVTIALKREMSTFAQTFQDLNYYLRFVFPVNYIMILRSNIPMIFIHFEIVFVHSFKVEDLAKQDSKSLWMVY